MAPLTVLRLRSLDLAIIERHLRIKIAQLPQLFLNAPVLIDVGALGGHGAGLAIEELVRALRSCKLVPVAIANLADELRDRAVAAGLGVMQQARAATRAPGPDRRDADRRERGRARPAAERTPRRGGRRAARRRLAPRRRPRAATPGRWSSPSRCAAARSSTRRTPTWSCWRRSTRARR